MFVREQFYEDFVNVGKYINIFMFDSRGLLFRDQTIVMNVCFNDELKEFKDNIKNLKKSALGAIIGDVVGSRFEFHPHKSKEFDLFTDNDCISKDGKLTLGYFVKGCRFTDDTVMTLAVAKSLIECNGNYDDLRKVTIKNMQELGRKYPLVGYGNNFNTWLNIPEPTPYNSYGNGSAMRISSVPYFARNFDELHDMVEKVTDITHNHPEGMKGAKAVADCIWFALLNHSKKEIKEYIEREYYKLDFNYDELVKNYSFDETCQGSVPQAIYAFLISNSFEDTIRTVISMGGDSDTMGAIAGAIAGAYYGIPEEIIKKVKEFLTDDLLEITEDFEDSYEKRK